MPNKGIARQLGISPKTVSNHVERVYTNWGCRTGRAPRCTPCSTGSWDPEAETPWSLPVNDAVRSTARIQPRCKTFSYGMRNQWDRYLRWLEGEAQMAANAGLCPAPAESAMPCPKRHRCLRHQLPLDDPMRPRPVSRRVRSGARRRSRCCQSGRRGTVLQFDGAASTLPGSTSHRANRQRLAIDPAC